jgi:arylformamidase
MVARTAFTTCTGGEKRTIMKIYDISMSIFEGMPVYKNKPEKQPSIQTTKADYVSESKIQLDVHTGTHVDAPLHMVEDGPTMEGIPLERLVGPCRVIHLSHVKDGIGAADLEGANIQPNEFVLFKTKNSEEEAFNFEFIYLKEDAAKRLVEIGIKGVGIDALGVERSQPGHPTHKALFGGDVIVIEGLRLKEVPDGQYLMVAAPLKLVGTDAAPARVLLVEGLI